MSVPARHGLGARQRRAGFTLVEVLTVVAVVSVLAALLLPALGRARQAALRAKCVHNLHQLGLACHMYWDEHGGAAFRWNGPATNGGQIYWFGWLEQWVDGNEGQRRFDRTLGALAPYLPGREVSLCPSLSYAGSFKFKATGATWGYGYNWHLSRPLHLPPYNMEQLRQADETVVLADAAQVNTFQYPASPENPLLEEFYYLKADEATVHFRHAQRASALFADGHVDPERPVPGSLDPNLPRVWVGRLRPEILRVP